MKKNLPDTSKPGNGMPWILLLLLSFTLTSVNAFSDDPDDDTEVCPFVEEDGIITMEAESGDLSGTYWVKRADIADHLGEGYLQFSGGSSMGTPSEDDNSNVITYSFRIDNPGRYSLKVRAYRQETEDNDIWVRFPTGNAITMIGDSVTGNVSAQWFKYLIGAKDQWHWFMKAQLTGVPHAGNFHDVYFEVSEPGIYSIQIKGRSRGFKMDRIALYNQTMGISGFHGMNASNPESERDNCEPVPSGGPYVANPLQSQEVYAEDDFSYTFPENTFMHPQDASLNYYVRLRDNNSLPDWLSFNYSTMTLSGTPAEEDGGRYYVMVVVRDPDQKLAIDEFTLTVRGNNPPEVNDDLEDQFVTAEDLFTFTFDENLFTDPDGHALTYTATQDEENDLPAWLSFNGENRTFEGTPSDNQVGTYHIRITADDNHGGRTHTRFDLHVLERNTAPVVAGDIPDQTATVDYLYSYTFSANIFYDEDGDELSYTSSTSSGEPLPAWLSFDGESRTFEGRPTEEDMGELLIYVYAHDNKGGTAFTSFTLTIDEPEAEILANRSANKNNCLNATVYPNPVENQFRVELGSNANGLSYSLLDQTGRTYLINNSGGNIDLDGLNLKSGLYMLRISSENEQCQTIINIIKK
ncbi:MAG: putative Ig domain-containing protein [Cytophagaceae bacterium]